MKTINRCYSAAITLFVGLVFTNPTYAQLKQVQTVYLLPLGGGLDQYLATRIVEQHLFQVVTDPHRADAIFVDRLGPGLETKLAELFPGETTKSESDNKNANLGGGAFRVGSTNLQRSKGTLFLIDRRNHTVLWSIYSTSRSGQSKDVNRNAESIATKLQLALQK
jgi:hypothetical protein